MPNWLVYDFGHLVATKPCTSVGRNNITMQNNEIVWICTELVWRD